MLFVVFFFSSRRRHTRFSRDWSSDVCSSDLDRFVETKEDQQPAIQYCYDLLAEVPADQLLQWDNISRMFDVTTLRDAPTGGTPIWLPLENADVPMLFDIVSCTSVVIKERYFQTICRQLSELLARPIR